MCDGLFSLIQDFTGDLICFICKKKSFKPKIMPCCGKIGCESCIENILKNNLQCPNCNESNFHDFLSPIHVHFIDNMEQCLNVFEQLFSEENICIKHKKPNEYYCTDCDQYLCSDCIYDELLSDHPNHKDHNIDSAKLKLQKDISNLYPLTDSIEEKSNSIMNLNSKLNKSMNSMLLDQHEIFRNMQASVESKKNMALKPLDNRINQLIEMQKKISKALNLVYQLISTQSSNILIEIPNILKESNAIDQEFKQLDPILPELSVSNDILPQYQSFQFEIPNFAETQRKFSQMGENEIKYILTKKQTISGNKWRAKIYPNGNTNDKGSYLSVFFELVRGNRVPSSYFYRVEIVSNDPSKQNIVKEYNSEFNINDTWGWNKVASLDTILNKNGYLDSKGTLKLILGIRAGTYYQVYKDLQEAVKYEYAKIKKLKKKIEKK